MKFAGMMKEFNFGQMQLKDNEGIPRSLILLMAVMAGLTVANLYYTQPLLEMMRDDIDMSQRQAGMINVAGQLGYAAGLCLIVPLGDLVQRRRLATTCMLVAMVAAMFLAVANQWWMLITAAALLGLSSITPQLFIPVAGQFSRVEDKGRNVGYILSGLLTGILASRVVSGLVGELLGWRAMFYIVSAVMMLCSAIVYRLLPDMARSFHGSYAQLLGSVWHIFRQHSEVRVYAVRAAFGFGSMLAVWACLAFHVSRPPLLGGSDMVGLLGVCGIAGALLASVAGKYIATVGIRRFSIAGATIQLLSWLVAWFFGHTVVGLAIAIILVDIGLQCLQLSNQSGCLQAVPGASSRTNTIFMTTYFIGGSAGTAMAAVSWGDAGWAGVCLVGLGFAFMSLAVSFFFKR